MDSALLPVSIQAQDETQEKQQNPQKLRKVSVRTESYTDFVDDGYKWNKYGRKMIKGRAFARSYYKCRSKGCRVKKHVERCTEDSLYVMTTYEGSHNHEPVMASSHSNRAYELSMQINSGSAFSTLQQGFVSQNSETVSSSARNISF